MALTFAKPETAPAWAQKMARERIERPARSERNAPERLIHNRCVAETQRTLAGAVALISELLSENGLSKTPDLLDLAAPDGKRRLRELTVGELCELADAVDRETDRLLQEGGAPAARA